MIFISYARCKTPKSLTSDAQIRGVRHREKLYEKRSYLRAWRRRPARGVAGNRRLGPIARPERGSAGLLRGRSHVAVENPSSRRERDRAGDRLPVEFRSSHARPTRLTFGGSGRKGRAPWAKAAGASVRRTRAGR